MFFLAFPCFYSDKYVTAEEGTGVVHQAPGFGEDDFRVCLQHGIVQKGDQVVCPVDASGRFTAEVNDFQSQHVKVSCVYFFWGGGSMLRCGRRRIWFCCKAGGYGFVVKQEGGVLR